MDSGRSFGREKSGSPKILQYLRPKEKRNFGRLYANNSQLVRTQRSQTEETDNYLNLDYEMHLGTKTDSLFFQRSRLPQVTEIQLLRNQCEQNELKF